MLSARQKERQAEICACRHPVKAIDPGSAWAIAMMVRLAKSGAIARPEGSPTAMPRSQAQRWMYAVDWLPVRRTVARRVSMATESTDALRA